jgi:short-subunit dehydrogenase
LKEVKNMVDVKNRWAFITGASRGIGYLSAKFMAEQGCNLILHSRKIEHTEEIIREAKALGVSAVGVEAELSDLDAVEAMLKKIDELGVRVDIVLNNAGVQIAYRNDFWKTPARDFSESFVINTIAPTMICYHFMPKMIENGFGRILNTTSGIRLEPQQAGYSASKAALDKVTIDLGSVVDGTDVMINLTDPGWCRTDLGGPNAPNAPESAIPGIVVGAFVDDKKSGRYLGAPAFSGMTLEDAVKKAEEEFFSPYGK